MYHVRITVQTRALPEMNQECIKSCLPRFVKIGMVFQFVIGSGGASPPASPHDCWPADHN